MVLLDMVTAVIRHSVGFTEMVSSNFTMSKHWQETRFTSPFEIVHWKQETLDQCVTFQGRWCVLLFKNIVTGLHSNLDVLNAGYSKCCHNWAIVLKQGNQGA